ncbi:predicted protein [Chaetomium globosum CBS 148.51]|uniref:Uncharacterized protein n=1 Tax=Chaetomium globosum (strain ATCC 6205 / CBS 148.51 / DSM 1962 / NBRC 6347 / NRRL 1970) TaxID=306901 RepID=Q2GVI1_CHAGB|nr:uncharacterized protein CHGG_08023 [Chaetomium globosum CBS 148.51]EAQ86770.1 predicted protein [Chaetomium globosum CBS 148.51]
MGVIDIPKEAENAMGYIVSAKNIMRGWITTWQKSTTSSNAVDYKNREAGINAFIARLDKVWLFLSNLQKQTEEHTPAVGAALVTLKEVARKLTRSFPSGYTLTDVGNVVSELEQARDAVRRARPGDLHHAEGNKQLKGGKIQINGSLAATQNKDRRLVVESRFNESSDGTQINAPVFGTADDVQKMFLAMNGVRA